MSVNMNEATKLITAYKKRKKAAIANVLEGVERRIPVYDKPANMPDRKRLGRVRVNNDLDMEKNGVFCNPSPGAHKGISKLSDGQYAFVYFYENESEGDWGQVTTPEAVAREIIKTGNTYLFLDKKYKELAELVEYASRRELLPAKLRRRVDQGKPGRPKGSPNKSK